MGINLHILSERAVTQTLYYSHECHMETRECIHDHTEDFRMVYDKKDFLALSDHWIRARKKFDELGQREPSVEHQGDLSYAVLEGQRLHHERAALEMTVGGADKDGGGDTIHFHYRHCRIHLTKCDFYRMHWLFTEAGKSYGKHYSSIIDLNDPKVRLRDTATDRYLKWLKEYEEGLHPKAEADDFWDMFLDLKHRTRPEEIQRPDGGFLKDVPRTRVIDEEFDKRYTFTMLECIKKYGYGEGPFKYDYMRAEWVDHEGARRLELTGSHRSACLVHLGFTNIPVVITNGE